MIIDFDYQSTQIHLDSFDGDHISNVIAKTCTFYEVSMLEFIQKLDPRATIIDVGANIGNHTVYFAKFINCNQVISIEPYARSFKKLKNNINNNKITDKVQILNVAAGSHNGRCSLIPGPATNIGLTKTAKGKDITITTLDTLVDDKEISLIKIDVEGNELDVLKGVKKILEKQSPFLFVEADTKNEKDAIDIFLLPFGYSSNKVFNATPTYFYQKLSKPV